MELFKLFGSILVDNNEANKSISKTTEHAEKNGNKMASTFKKVGGAIIAGFSIAKIREFGIECSEAFKVQKEAEVKLETVMRQRMNATDESIKSIKDLASAQQELGVVGDEVQLAGAQQLATFLDTDSALKTLIPAMNNLAVQQNGVNVSSGNMVNIGNLMGKVMQGQTGALKKVGVTFTAAQEKVLKYGNEQERAAMLAEVITDNVGNMNAEIAKTDDGKQQQYKNTLGDLKEVIGQKLIPVQTAYYEILMKLGTFATDKLIPFITDTLGFLKSIGPYLTAHKDEINNIIPIVGALTAAVIAYKSAAVLTSVIQGFQQAKLALTLFTAQQGASNIAQAALNGTLTLGETIVALFTGKVTLAELASAAWSKAQTVLNAVLSANPIGLVVAAITGLVTAFVIAYNKCEWFRNMVNGAFNAIKNTAVAVFNGVKSAIINPIDTAKNFVKSAIDKIKSFFNFQVSFPHIKLPHFKVSGSANPIKWLDEGVPKLSVEWYKSGAILKKPTPFGINQETGKVMGGGEAGYEAVAPLAKLEEYYKKWSQSGNSEMIAILDDIRRYLADDERWYRTMLRALTDGSFSIVLDGREVGRIVRKYA